MRSGRKQVHARLQCSTICCASPCSSRETHMNAQSGRKKHFTHCRMHWDQAELAASYAAGHGSQGAGLQ